MSFHTSPFTNNTARLLDLLLAHAEGLENTTTRRNETDPLPSAQVTHKTLLAFSSLDTFPCSRCAVFSPHLRVASCVCQWSRTYASGGMLIHGVFFSWLLVSRMAVGLPVRSVLCVPTCSLSRRAFASEAGEQKESEPTPGLSAEEVQKGIAEVSWLPRFLFSPRCGQAYTTTCPSSRATFPLLCTLFSQPC